MSWISYIDSENAIITQMGLNRECNCSYVGMTWRLETEISWLEISNATNSVAMAFHASYTHFRCQKKVEQDDGLG